MKKSIKTYNVVFSELNKEGDWQNTTSKTILAEDALQAIEVATELLGKKEKKTYYAESVTLIAVID